VQGNYLQVNFPNVISITIMAAVGVMLLGATSAAVNKFRGANE